MYITTTITSTEGGGPGAPCLEVKKPKPLTDKTIILAVKLTAFFLLIGFLHLSARTTAQQRISITMKGAKLEKVFAEIEKRSGFTVFYNVEVLKVGGAVSIDVKDATIEDVMRQCLQGLPLEFTVQEKTIFVKKEVKKITAEIPVGPGNPVPQIVSGVVKSAEGQPLVGATVFIPKLKRTDQTNTKGEFTLKGIPDGKYELEISFIGYERYKTTITVSDHAAWVEAAMKAGNSQLDETVVKGYYNTTNRLNTGDVTTVKGEDIEKQPVSDPILALEGRVPGLYIQQASGIPGAYSSIGIMGPNSIANGNDPLYIIDGVPFSSTSLTIPNIDGGAVGAPGNSSFNQSPQGGGGGISPFNSLNPADIESIVVLKDADATAIYGSRGANGVVLITTKKGKAGATRVGLNVYTGGGKPTRMMHLLNTTQYLAMRRQAFQNDGLPVPSITTNPTDNNYDINGEWDTTRYTDWQKVLIGNTARFTNLQGTVSGGDANTQFLIGGGYSTQGTPYIGNYFDDKIMGNTSLTHTSTNQRFHLQLGINYAYDNNKLPTFDFTQTSLTLAPDAPALFDKNGNLNWQMLNGTSTFYNPVASTYQNAKAATENLITDLNLSYQLLPGLKLLSTFGYNHAEMHQSFFSPESAVQPPYNTNPNERSYQFGTTTSGKWIIEPQLNYQQNLGPGKLEALVGTTFEQNSSNYLATIAYGFTSDALITDPSAAAAAILESYNDILYRYNAIYGRFGYNWAEKYLVNFTARRDGSSRFGPGKQFGNFGAAGIGWIFSKENVIQKTLPFLSYGKVRASYGITGNDQISDYQFLSTYTPISGVAYQGLTGLTPTSLTNPNFAWEVVKKLEGGIDLGFLKDRILMSAIYYRNRTGNQLVGYSLPYITGFNSVQANLPAVVQNTGLELVLNTTLIKSRDFSWTLMGNLTVPSNKLVSFPGLSASSYASSYVVGQPLFIQKRFHYTGVNPQTGLYSFATKNANVLPSNPQDLITTKSITQKYYGGVDNKLAYKGFSLDVFVQFVDQLGVKYVQGTPGAVNQNEPTAILNNWQSTGNVTSTQRFGTTGTTSTPQVYYGASDAVITNKSFVRLKNLALSYQIPTSWKTKSRLESARIYLQCQNLFTITKFLGLDPETGTSNLPPLRMITSGIQVGF